MALADAILGQGTTLFHSPEGTTWTEFVDISDIGEPNEGDVEQIESTPLNPSTDSKEFLNGLKETGEFTFEQFYNKTRYTTAIAMIGTKKHLKITFTDGSTLTFQANIKKARPMGFARAEPIKIAFAAQITGAMTFTPGT